MRYFIVSVSHYSTKVEEQQTPLKKYEWGAVVDGVQCFYDIRKENKGIVKNWFERGTVEVKYHAKNLSQTGFVLWSKRSPKPRQTSKKEAVIKAKMEKLL